nr:hypothetical protein [Tanacetum cinerariifolium]
RNLQTTSSGTAANVEYYNCSEKDGRTKGIKCKYMLDGQNSTTNFDSTTGLGYDFAFLSEVQTPSTSYENPLFAKDNQEQKYPKQPKIINNTIGDDQIDSNIIFDEPNGDVNSGSVEYDNNVQESYELEQLARNAYKEAVRNPKKDRSPLMKEHNLNENDRRVNKRLIQTQESKVDSSKALDVTECSETKSDKHDTSSTSGNCLTHVVNADIRPVNEQVPFAEFFKPSPNVDHPVPEVPTPVPAASTSPPSSTTID